MAQTLGTSTTYQSATQRYLDREVLPVAQRHLIVRQLASRVKVPRNMGLTYTATRFNRFTLPYAPLNEGIPPAGQAPQVSQVTGVLNQWGDRANITDIASFTSVYDVLEQASRLLQLQVPETLERNAFLQLNATQQVNFVNQRGASGGRSAIQAGDLLDPTTINRTVANMKTLGAYMFNGPAGEHVRKSPEEGPRKGRANPQTHEHYVCVLHPLVANDFAGNSTVQSAWSQSDINKLYINEIGQWRGLHFVESNMVPFWQGLANNANGLTYTAGTAGNLPTNANTFIRVTGSDPQNQYETLLYQVSAAVSVTGPNGSVAVTLPTTPANYTYSVYISQGSGTSPANLGAVLQGGPMTGPYAGQATQLPAGATVVITNVGIPQVPPAAPASGINVFRSYVFGEHFFAAMSLEDIEWMRLTNADKSDPLNQLKVVGWKTMDGIVILNQQFGAAIESSASSTGTFG